MVLAAAGPARLRPRAWSRIRYRIATPVSQGRGPEGKRAEERCLPWGLPFRLNAEPSVNCELNLPELEYPAQEVKGSRCIKNLGEVSTLGNPPKGHATPEEKDR